MVTSLGREWDVRDFNQLATVISHFTFPVFITFLEGRYIQDTELTALENAVDDVYGNFVQQILKHVSFCFENNLIDFYNIKFSLSEIFCVPHQKNMVLI